MIGVNGMLPPALTHDEDYVAFDAGYHPAPIIATSIILGHAERNRPFGPPGHVKYLSTSIPHNNPWSIAFYALSV